MVYLHHKESPIARPDQVLFKKNDLFDFSAIDGNPYVPGVQPLQLMESAVFTGQPGEMIARSNGVFVDLDGDKVGDFGVLFAKPVHFDLTVENFIL